MLTTTIHCFAVCSNCTLYARTEKFGASQLLQYMCTFTVHVYLQIYKGTEEEDENLLRFYSGRDNPVSKTVVASSNQVLIIFDSSPYVTDTGFLLTYQIYVYREPTTTEPPKQTSKPLSPQGRLLLDE